MLGAAGLFAQLGPGTGPGHGPRIYQPSTDIKMTDPVVKSAGGKVDRAIVKRYMRRDLNKYRYCYEKALAADPTLRGTLTIQFHVLVDGTLTSVRVEGIANDVENCVASFVRRLQLPKLPEEADVRTKVMFKPPKPTVHPYRGGCGGLDCGRLG